jgi:hypothetical protein
MDTPAAAGTLWGLWNACVEGEDYRAGRNADYDTLFGERAQVKQRAFDACLSLV